MANIKPSDHGIVVEHKETNVRYAISDRNYNEKVHRKVRDLRAGESVRSYRPKAKSRTDEADLDQTEGSAPAESQEKKGN